MGLIKKAQQRLFFLRQLKKHCLRREILIQFYRTTIESVITSSIMVWYGNSTKKDRKKLDRIVKTAGRIIGAELTPVASLFLARARTRARKIVMDKVHPANYLFRLLPSGKRFGRIKTGTDRFKDSFYPTAVSILNGSYPA